MKHKIVTKSNYLKKQDLGQSFLQGRTVTIKGHRYDELDGEAAFVIEFVEDLKPMVLNNTNQNVLCDMVGGIDEDGDAYIDLEKLPKTIINVYFDPNVVYQGKRTGGLRLRPYQEIQPPPPPQPGQVQKVPPQPTQAAGEEHTATLPGDFPPEPPEGQP